MPETTANVSYLILTPMGQETEESKDKNFVLMGPLTKKQLAEMGMVKDSSITRK
jgi:hypothetical protein